MSSLTSIGINKNKKGFAPKLNSKRNVRKPATTTTATAAATTAAAAAATTAATTATSSSSTTAKERTLQQIKQEQTIEPPILHKKITERISDLNRTIDESHNRTLITDDTDTNDLGLTQEELRMNELASRKRYRSEPSPSPMDAPSPVAPLMDGPDCAFEDDGRPILKIERITPGPLSAMRKSMSRTVKEDEGERIDSKEMLAAAPLSSVPASPMATSSATSPGDTYTLSLSPSPSPSPPAVIRPTKKNKKTTTTKAKGKGKASEVGISTPKTSSTTTTKTKKTTKSKAGGSSIGIGIPSSSGTAITIGAPISRPGQAQPEEDELEDDEEGDEMGTGRRGRKKQKGRKIFDFHLPENMKTLDDINEDPADVDSLEKPMTAFTKDIDGVVSKNFKEMEIARYEALRKQERAAKMSLEELAELKKKEAEEAAEAARKKRIAKEKAEEKRRKEQDGHILAESSNALQVRLVNGQIVLDTDSLTIERTERDIDYGDGSVEVVEENSMTKKVNSMTYSKRKASSRWSAAETEEFYNAISQFGTDFEMVSMVMPGRTRAQIRSKFSREEKMNPEKVTDYLIRKKKPLDLKKYEEMAGIELEAVPEDFDSMQLA